MAGPAPGGRDDEEAEEGEAGGIAYHRDRRDRRAVAQPDDEALGIASMEGDRVVVAGIPAFARRPVDRAIELGPGHRADGQVGNERLRHRGQSRPMAPRSRIRAAMRLKSSPPGKVSTLPCHSTSTSDSTFGFSPSSRASLSARPTS